MRKLAGFATGSVGLAIVLLLWVSELKAASVTLTFRYTRVVELNCSDGSGCPNDYYPKVEIDGQGLDDGRDRFCCAHDTDFRPNWVFSRTMDTSRNPIAIHVELWDQDNLSQDDAIDIANGGDYMDLTFDLNTCTFQGAGLTSQQGAGIPSLLQGQSEGSGDDSARIYFSITTPACIAQAKTVDTDGDGLFNAWELPGVGIDVDNDGTPDLFLSSDPMHKDLFVEVDWMECSDSLPPGGCSLFDHSHAPVAGSLDDVTNAFKNAPVGNPDGNSGITLHAMPDEAVGDQVDIRFRTEGPGPTDDFNDIKLGSNAGGRVPGPCEGSFGTAAERSSPNCAKILQAKRLAFRYMIFAHSFFENPNSSGSSELAFTPPPGNVSVGGNDFIVTLGPSFGSGAIEDAGAQRVAEASTFMHELGHTLGLQHGGGDSINCKPNYLSIMNYTLQFPIRDPNRPLDYTSAARGTALGLLDENALNERAGIGGPPGRRTVYGVNGNPRTADANAATIDWNEINGLETNAAADINFIAALSPTSENGGCSTASANQRLFGFDDWASLVYNFRNSPDFSDGATRTAVQELTGETVRLMKNPPPDLKVAKGVDKATAAGGDTLTYTVTVTNLEPPEAFNVSVTDRLPDNSTQTRPLPNLVQGASNAHTLTYLVPCAATDGTVLTNRASVTGTNALGYADVNLSNNSASASTTVQAPVLTLSKTATASVNAGETITYTITYQNTGAGGAANIVITDTLPVGVYYSTALDTGTGPQPSTVTVNGDGTRTLTWLAGNLAGNSGPQTIRYTARPTLLFLGGETLRNSARLSFTNANGCAYAPVTASASTVITVVPPSKDPLSMGFWRNHSEQWSAEILARIQATDLRYDTNGDGSLSTAEVAAMLAPGGNQPKVLQMQLLATYFNMATRRINARTLIESRTANTVGLHDVAQAAIYGKDTLALPVDVANRPRYENATQVLDEINANKSEVF